MSRVCTLQDKWAISGEVQEVGGGFVRHLTQHQLPTMVLSGAAGLSNFGCGCIHTCALAEETLLCLTAALSQLSFVGKSEAGATVSHSGGSLDNSPVLRGYVPLETSERKVINIGKKLWI